MNHRSINWLALVKGGVGLTKDHEQFVKMMGITANGGTPLAERL